MTASNDNRPVRKKRSQTKAPGSLAKLTRILADIYAGPARAVAGHQDESLTWLGEERRVPALNNREPDTAPVADAER